MGLLKTGHKTLYLRNSSSAYCTRQPLCVLDFFVLPQHQRQGIGHAMFEVIHTDMNLSGKHHFVGMQATSDDSYPDSTGCPSSEGTSTKAYLQPTDGDRPFLMFHGSEKGT